MIHMSENFLKITSMVRLGAVYSAKKAVKRSSTNKCFLTMFQCRS